MRQYEKIMVPADEKETSPHFIAGGMWESKSNVIVTTASEIIDLFQQVIEYSHPILPRDTADKFLAEVLKNQK